jgi:tetratricopeptide (TPR) repeat protein
MANTYYALGYSWRQESLVVARQYYDQALLIYQREAPRSVVLACTYKHLGDIEKQQSQSTTACAAYEKALEIYQTILPGYS